MASQYFGGDFTHVVANASITDVTPPTFSGITFLDVESRGQIRAGWSAASDATAPIRYEVYIQVSTATGLFSTSNIVAITPNLQYDIFTLPDGSFLMNGSTYFVGVRSIDGVSNRDSNVVSMSVISTGVLTAIDVYDVEASWSIDTSNNFQVTMWANRNSSLAGGSNGVLGSASYQVFDKSGAAVVGMSGSVVSANAEYLFVASAVTNLLTKSAEHYELKVTVTVDGEARTNILPLARSEAAYELDGLFIINNANEFDGTFWARRNGVIATTNLGTGSFQVYDHNGAAVVGMAQSGLTPDVNGIYKITQLASTLADDYPGFTVKITITIDNITQSAMIARTAGAFEYKPKAQFSINALNQLQATFWVENNNVVELVGLGAASYTIYDVTGAAVAGLSQAGITADANGRYQITAVSAALLTDLTHYSARIGIVVHGVERVAYKGFTLLGT